MACKKNKTHKQSDSRSTKELIQLALTTEDELGNWEAVTILHRRGTREVLEAARTLCQSDNPDERCLGADILAQLGYPGRTFPDECFAILVDLFQNDTDSDVLNATCSGLGRLGNPKAIELIAPLKSHTDAIVRLGVVFGIINAISHSEVSESSLAVQTLIELSSDADVVVRDWATFALGSQTSSDSEAIREILWQRLADEDEVVRGEAIAGLVERGDERVLKAILTELSQDNVSTPTLEAARQLGDSQLYPALLKLRARVPHKGDFWDDEFERAFNACKPSEDKSP
jgi:HEAT repeat protein